MQPGSTITPGEPKEDTPVVDTPPEQPAAPAEVKAEPAIDSSESTPPASPEQPSVTEAQAAAPTETPEASAKSTTDKEWAYTAETTQPNAAPAPASHHDTVSWTASEYIAHDKSPMWFIVLGIVGVAIAALVYLITRDLVAPIVTVIVAVLFGVSAARPPRVLKYVIDDKGIDIGGKHYIYAMFKSFGVTDEEALSSITLLSTKRFMPPLSIYYPPEQEEKIVEKLADYLPFEHHKADVVERFMRQIRF